MAESKGKLKQDPIKLFTSEGMGYLADFMTITQGGDPRARQTLNDFIDLKSNVQKTNLPTKKDVQRVAYFLYVGKTKFPDRDDDPFTVASDCIAIASMARGGQMAKHVVDLHKRTPSMVDMKTVEEAQERGIVNKLFDGGGKE